MKKIYKSIDDVPFEVGIDSKYYEGYEKTSHVYKFRLTAYLLDLINETNNEGLKKQFLPQGNELSHLENEFKDVANENSYTPVTGIVHRYPNKVLLLLTLNCPTYCRFCFRKEKLNDTLQMRFLTTEQIDNAFNYIKENKIEEVIFSGGDPFFCSKKMLFKIVDRLVDDDNIKIVRYHTRYFTFDPNIIDNELLNIISRKKSSFIVMHINQPEEITMQMQEAVERCISHGIPLFSQTALLKGVNDNELVLKELFTKLIHSKVKPYYLFHTDPSQGLSHYRVKLKEGIRIYKALYDRISGLAMPTYLFNVPGGHGHSIIDLNNFKEIAEDTYEIENFEGGKVIYKDY